jgi:type I restriction enzyme S subunit
VSQELPAGWAERALYDLGFYQNGRPFRPDETTAKSGLRVIKIAELNNGVSPKTGTYDGPVDPKHLIDSGDLIFAWSGTIVVKRWRGGRAVLNQHLFKVTPRGDVDDRYLQYLLESFLPVFERIVQDKRTTMGHVKVEDLKRLRTPVPPFDQQSAIAEVLTSIDEAIDSCDDEIGLIAPLARDLYALAVAESADKKSVRVRDVASLIRGVSYRSADLKPASVALLTLKSFNRRGGYQADGLKEYAGEYKLVQRLSRGEIVVAMTDITQNAEVVGRALRVPSSDPYDLLLPSTDLAIVRSMSEDARPEILWAALAAEPFRQRCRSMANGTTVLHLPVAAITDYEFEIPGLPARDHYIATATPLWAALDAAMAERRKLASLRAEVLGDLVDGRLSVEGGLAA